jgi:3-oxoacyl-[acyl-carrier-protein] synthase-3
VRDAYVSDFAYALGERTQTLAQAAARGQLVSTPQALEQAGFARHHVCGDNSDAYTLARRCVQDIEPRLGDIDAIVYVTCLPINGNVGAVASFRDTRDVKFLMDFPGSRLQADFGLSGATVIGLNQQACTGMLGSLYLARLMVAADPAVQRVLCLTADRFPARSLYEQAYNLISDGAAACIVSAEPCGYRIVATHAVTNGALCAADDDETVGSFFNYAHRVIQDVLSKARLTIDDIAWIVPQNTNLVAWQVLARLLGADFDRVYSPTLADVGHVISGDNIINLKHLTDQEQVQPGQKVLLFMAGYGLNWQAVILEKA